MEESKKKIVKWSKILSFVLLLDAVSLFAASIGLLGCSVAILIDHDLAEPIYNTLNDMEFLKLMEFDSDLGIFGKAMSGTVITALAALGTSFVIMLIRRMAKMITDGQNPFTKKLAHDLRLVTIVIVFVFIDNIVVGIITFTVMLLFAALIDYGAYLQEKADETNRIQEEMIISFAEITENKSTQTGNHVKRVSEYSQILAKEMGLPEDTCEHIRLASTMHDIGKLMIPNEILEKPARLTDEEFSVIKKHSGYGGELLDQVEGEIMQLARTIALDHHERPDGKGYPDGKHLDDISIAGRIVAVADVYDALTSKRSYKDAWDPKQAFDEIVKNSGAQFDEKVIEAFKSAYPTIEDARCRYADNVSALSFKPA